LQGSKVTDFALQILARLKRGVIVKIGDTRPPHDEICGHALWQWNGPYLAASVLLFDAGASRSGFQSGPPAANRT